MMKKLRLKTLVLGALLLSLDACTSIVDVTDLVDANALAKIDINETLSLVERDAKWWALFEDSDLNRVIETALANNPNLDIARANVASAYAVFRDANNNGLPMGEVSLNYTSQNQAIPGFTDERIDVEIYQLGGGLNWSLDLFGRLDYAAQAAQADAQAQYLTFRDVQVGITAQVATTYAQYRGAIARHEFAQRNLAVLQQTQNIVQDRSELGFSSELDRLRIESQVMALESTLPALKIDAIVAKNSLASLLGLAPNEFEIDSSYRKFPALDRPLALGDAGRLLSRRADVQIAERQVASAAALTLSQRAALYPDLSIGGFLGFLAPGFGQLNGGNEAWSIAPSLSWQAFDLDSVRARIDSAEANQLASVATFQATVLRALAESQTSLDTYVQVQRQQNILEQQVSASDAAFEIARLQFEAGIIDLFDLLDVERSLIDSQDNLERIKSETFIRVIEVYRSFGGGLIEEDLRPRAIRIAQLQQL